MGIFVQTIVEVLVKFSMFGQFLESFDQVGIDHKAHIVGEILLS